MPTHVMLWIAAVFPILSFVVGGLLYFLTRNGWVPTIVVFGGTLAATLVWFSAKFWPWWLLYLFLSWLGSWAGHYARRTWRPQRV